MTELVDQPSRYRLVDCDVHPIMKGGMRDLQPYLSRSAQRRLGLDDRRNLTTVGHREPVSIPRNMLYVNQAGVLRDDAPTNWYDPGRFWSGDSLPLRPGWSYGVEVEVARSSR